MNKQSGIYKIVNTATNDFYIGSSIDINNRWKQHRYSLIRNAHPNQHLQHAWNKYGKECFRLETIMECDTTLLLEKEQYFIDALKPSYNFCPVAGTVLGVKRSDETRKKMSVAQKGRVVSEETKEKIKKSRKMQELIYVCRILDGKVMDLGNFTIWNNKQDINYVYVKQNRNPLSEERKKQISDQMKGRKVSEETKQKISEKTKGISRNIGSTRNEETKKRMSEIQTGEQNPMYGKRQSKESNKKRSETLKGNQNALGAKRSEETRAKISAAMKAVRNKNK